MSPFFSYKSYDPPHQSFPVGWGVCLNLFYTGKFCIHPFFFFLLEDWEEKIGHVIAVDHTYKVSGADTELTLGGANFRRKFLALPGGGQALYK